MTGWQSTYQDDLCFIKVVLYSHNGVSFLWVLEEYQRHIKSYFTLLKGIYLRVKWWLTSSWISTALGKLSHTLRVFNDTQLQVTQLTNVMNTLISLCHSACNQTNMLNMRSTFHSDIPPSIFATQQNLTVCTGYFCWQQPIRSPRVSVLTWYFFKKASRGG